MSESLNFAYEAIDADNAEKPAATRRELVAGMAATIGGMGLLGLADDADAAPVESTRHTENPQTVLNVAATAEVLATVINTVGYETVDFSTGSNPEGTRRNIAGAARHELIHYNTLVSLGGRALTTRVYIPDMVFSSNQAFLNTVEVGDTVFINAYLIAITVFGNRDMGRTARIAAEFMGVEAVHRAVARQGNFKVGNDKAYNKYSQAEDALDSPIHGVPGFRRITSAVTFLQSRGIGFGAPGRLPNGTTPPGRFYDFGEVSQRTPDPDYVNQRAPG